MKKLEIVLQSRLFYIILITILFIFIIVSTIVIKYDTKLKQRDYLEGRVIDYDIDTQKITFIIQDKEKVLCNYYLNNEEVPELLGKKVRVEGTIKYPSNNTIPNTFNYRKYLYQNKIYVTMTVKQISILKNENIFYHIKNSISNHLNNYSSRVKTYLYLFLMGNRNYLSDDMYDIYRTNGIWHLFAVSGMHIGLIIAIMSKILKKLKLKNIIISLFLGYFMFLTSFSASVMRATIFYYLTLLLKKFKINIKSYQVLLLTASIILFIDPFMIYNLGFQYSFLITLTIMLNSNKITGNYFAKILKISLLSLLVSLPITINTNYEINLLSLFVSLIYVPFISIIFFPLCFLIFFFPFLSFILNWLILILEFTNKIFYVLRLVLIIPKMPIIIVILYYFILMLAYFKQNKLILFLIPLMIINILIPKLDSSSYVYFLDVGQGDSSLLISPHKNKVFMIDTGGILNSDYKPSDNVVLFLKSLGISKIDTIILSHGDYDHLGDAFNIINKFKVSNVLFNQNDYNELELNLIKLLQTKKIKYAKIQDNLKFDKYYIKLLNTNTYDNENDNSAVLYLKINDVKFLFMGDASVNVESDLIYKYNLPNIDILKVGHHGSKTSTSTEFINKVKPKYAIISVGKNNMYGHPNREVLNNLEKQIVYRTDEMGSINFRINNKNLEIKTYAP